MKYKYKVGDKVLLKTRAQFEEEFGPEWRTTVHQGWTDGMDEWFGKEITISRIDKNSVSLHYSAKESMYFFSEEMIVGKAKESTEPVFSVGQQVRFKTEEEFLKEFGPKWTSEVKYGWNSDGEMDYLFGKHFIIESIEDKYVKGHREGWNVSTDMITSGLSTSSSSSFHKYKLGDKITLMGIEYTLYGEEGYYYWYSNGLGNGKIFDVLDLNKESFTKSIVGYYEGGAFPPMKTLEDIEKITNALITKCFEHYSSQPDLELDDEVIFTVGGKDYKYTVEEDARGFYCEGYNLHSDEIFHVLGITKKEASSKALGYYEGGWFPYTHTLKDLTILVNYIREKCTEHNYKLRDITIRNFVPEGSGILEQIERSHLVPFEVNNAYEELLSDMIIVQLETYSHPIELWQHDADKVNIFKLETNEDSIEKPEVKHIINIFDYEV